MSSVLKELRDHWSYLRFEDFGRALGELDPRLHCERLVHSNDWFLSYDEPAAVPLAEWLASELNVGPRLLVGRPAGSFAEAIEAARDQGVDLSTSRVRVGFSRGHLLDVYVLVPLDVEGSEEQLQVAAEVFLEALVGDRVVDIWVANVAVDRISRHQGLKVLSSAGSGSQSYPLVETTTLIQRGITGLLRELPTTLLEPALHLSDWTALSMEEVEDEDADDYPPSERRFVSTRFPEAIKASLQGLPFSSSRFTKGDEILVWFAWSITPAERRMAVRAEVEEFFHRDFSRCATRKDESYILGGTGFGRKYDFVDIWLKLDQDLLRDLGQELARMTGRVRLGFYDSAWRDEQIEFAMDSADWAE